MLKSASCTIAQAYAEGMPTIPIEYTIGVCTEAYSTFEVNPVPHRYGLDIVVHMHTICNLHLR